nr:GILT-like protein 1 [Leptinotarsa decemlineata]
MKRNIANSFLVMWVFSFQEVLLDNRVNVEVLFESLCPDSHRFIKNQLYPSWKEISPYVNLKLVPFGKSSSLDNGAKFVCQHGPLECKGNRIMTCAYNMLPDQDRQVEFTNCFMESFRSRKDDPQEFGQQCAQSVGLDANEILDCYNSEEGTILQLTAEKDTARIRPVSVPTILYEGKLSDELHNNSIENFRGVVCELARRSYPEACQG